MNNFDSLTQLVPVSVGQEVDYGAERQNEQAVEYNGRLVQVRDDELNARFSQPLPLLTLGANVNLSSTGQPMPTPNLSNNARFSQPLPLFTLGANVNLSSTGQPMPTLNLSNCEDITDFSFLRHLPNLRRDFDID